MLEGLHNGGDQIGATTHRLGQDNVRRFVRAEPPDGGDQIIEAAAETRARNLLHVEPLAPQAFGVNQVCGLIVGDDANAQALRHVMPRQASKHRRLSGPEEAAHH
jgi:hypothetical protein